MVLNTSYTQYLSWGGIKNIEALGQREAVRNPSCPEFLQCIKLNKKAWEVECPSFQKKEQLLPY